MTTTADNLKKLQELLERLRRFNHAVRIVSFDRSTLAPERAGDEEDETLNFLSTEAYKMTKDPAFVELVEELHRHSDELGPEDQRLVEDLFEAAERNSRIPPEVFAEAQKTYLASFSIWQRAKEQKNYSLFAPALAKNIAVTKKLLDLRPVKGPTYYDTLIGNFEKGFGIADYDRFFEALKAHIVPLVRRIAESKVKIRTDFLARPVPLEKQEAFSHYLMDLIGFDSRAGLLATSEHPFTSTLARFDTRITTHYYLDNFISNMYSVIHEGGHAIFGQNEPDSIYEHYLEDSMSMAMHESVSRFYENRLGRSREFVGLIYPKIQEIFHAELGDVSEEELYLALNCVEPSLIRTEADELTYSLHIIIRYELEKYFMNEPEPDIENLNRKWNELYREYLGVEPQNDAEGILQDVHWTDSYGYFPTYAIGNAYNAMYFERMKRDLDPLAAVARGDFAAVNGWMKEHVFKKASLLRPKEWIRDITGRDLDPTDFIEYLEDKYTKIYQL